MPAADTVTEFDEASAQSEVHAYLRAVSFAVSQYALEQVESWSLVARVDAPIVRMVQSRLEVNIVPINATSIRGYTAELLDQFSSELVSLIRRPHFDEQNQSVLALPRQPQLYWTMLVYRGLMERLKKLPISREYWETMQLPPVEFGAGDFCWVRAGNLELRALSSFLFDRADTEEAAVNVVTMAENVDHIMSICGPNREWPYADAFINMARLHWKAGWYAPAKEAPHVLRDWADRYLAGLRSGSLLSTHSVEFSTLAPLTGAFAGVPMKRFDDRAFERALDQSRVLAVTAFAAEIDQSYKSGNLARFWSDVEADIQPKSLVTLEPPMSAWPYRPHRNWSESFAALCDNVGEAIQEHDIDLLVASCACYGLPLADFVRRTYGIRVIYPGHVLNAAFGILTNGANYHSYYDLAPDSPHWVHGTLGERFEHVKTIDEGRYTAVSM